MASPDPIDAALTARRREEPLAGRRFALALTGGAACFKAAELLRELQRCGADVQVLASEAALKFITVAQLQALSGNPVVTTMWDERADDHMPHIRIGRQAEAIVVVPASADLIARLAQGRADDIVSLTCLARPRERCRLFFAPAMNREMWSHPATQRNVSQVEADGGVRIGPDEGLQACGETGEGRMSEAADIVEALRGAFSPKLLAGRRILITAGPTYEALDPVRGITNLSSGKMGFAIAKAAQRAGAQVKLVAGPVSLPTPSGVRRVDVRSARQMLEAVEGAVAGQDAFIATAAVADWRPAQAADQKIKKDGSGEVPALAFVENPDILATIARRPDAPYCVGFAAESHDLAAHARAKRLRKGVPLLVGNIGPQTFGLDDNALLLVDDVGERELPRASKDALAVQLVEELARRLDAARPRLDGQLIATFGTRR